MRFNGGKLKALRDSRKWDQHRLAEAARAHGTGITQSQISRYENGQEPSGRNAMALAAALGVTVEELYGADAEDEEAASMPSHAAVSFFDAVDQLVTERVHAALRARVPEGVR